MGEFTGKGLVLRGMSSGLTRIHRKKRVQRLAVSQFCSRAGNAFIFVVKTQSEPGCGMGGLKGEGLVLRGMHIKPHKGLRVQRLAVSEFCNRAGHLFTFVGKHKAHPGAVWGGSKEKFWFCVGCSSGLTRVSEFSAYSFL